MFQAQNSRDINMYTSQHPLVMPSLTPDSLSCLPLGEVFSFQLPILDQEFSPKMLNKVNYLKLNGDYIEDYYIEGKSQNY